MLRSVLVVLALGAVMTEAAYAAPSLTATVSPQAAVYPDTKELTYRVEVSTTEETRLALVASNGAGLWIHPDGGSLEGPGTLTEGPQPWVVPGPPPPGSCEAQTADDWRWSQEFTLDLPADSVSTLVLPMLTGTLKPGSPSEYWFTLAGAGPMPRVPVSGPVFPPTLCAPPPCPIFTLAPPRPAGVDQMVIVGQWHCTQP